MSTAQERLNQLNEALMSKMYICSSGGEVSSFPPLLKVPYQVNGIGLVVCQQGSFRFALNRDNYSAHAGETLFIPEHSLIKITQESEDLEVFILIYDIWCFPCILILCFLPNPVMCGIPGRKRR